MNKDQVRYIYLMINIFFQGFILMELKKDKRDLRGFGQRIFVVGYMFYIKGMMYVQIN